MTVRTPPLPARAGAMLLAALLLAGPALAAPDADAALRHDPFKRPHLGPGPAPRPPAAELDGAPPAAPEPLPWQPELRGVMLAGADSIANVEGRILRIGESVDGWRLLRVGDGQAVFAKARAQTTLTMNIAGQARR